MKKQYSWTWSIGETYYKSPIRRSDTASLEPEHNELEPPFQVAENAIQQSLNGFECIASRNKREELDDKISDRQLLFQRGTNPFLQNTSYVDDVVARDHFLKPRNTTSEKLELEQES